MLQYAIGGPSNGSRAVVLTLSGKDVIILAQISQRRVCQLDACFMCQLTRQFSAVWVSHISRNASNYRSYEKPYLGFAHILYLPS